MVYEFIKKYFSKNEEKTTNSVHHLVAGGVSKVIASSVTYPYQVIKTRLQQIDGNKLYNGTIDCIKKTYSSEGVL